MSPDTGALAAAGRSAYAGAKVSLAAAGSACARRGGRAQMRPARPEGDEMVRTAHTTRKPWIAAELGVALLALPAAAQEPKPGDYGR